MSYSEEYEKKLAWLQQLKAGDEVILQTNSVQSIRKVVRVTPKQVMVDVGHGRVCEESFWRKDGRKVGSNAWSRGFIAMPIAKNMQEIRDRDEMRDLRYWLEKKQFTLPQLRAMKSAFDAIAIPAPEG